MSSSSAPILRVAFLVAVGSVDVLLIVIGAKKAPT